MKSHLACSLFLTTCLLAPSAGWSIDGGGPGFAPTPDETYYEASLATTTVDPSEFAATGGTLPSELHVLEADGRVEYRLLSSHANATEWELLVEVAERPHERVDAVYEVIAALALPESFQPQGWRVPVRQGGEGNTVPFVYGGEKVNLKRDRALERSWLPGLTGANGLPDLTGTGYAWTLWSTVLRYDPNAGGTFQALGTLRYQADAGESAPNPDDSRSSAYLITWIPDIGNLVHPFAIRLDVGPVEE